MTTITCKVPEEMNAQLEAVAARRHVSKSSLLREALENNLRKAAREVRLSAYDLMKDGCGILKGGPSDLSWNKKRMKGYGRD